MIEFWNCIRFVMVVNILDVYEGILEEDFFFESECYEYGEMLLYKVMMVL